MKLKLPVKAILLVVIPTAVQLIFVASLAGLLHESEQEALKADKARQVAEHINRFLLRIMFGAGGIQATAMSADKTFLKFGFSTDMEHDLRYELEETEKLVADDPELLTRVQNLRARALQGSASLQKIKTQLEGEGFSINRVTALNDLRKDLNDVSHSAVGLLRDVQMIEDMAPSIQAEKRRQIQAVLIAATLLSIAIALVMVYALNKSILERLNIVNDNSMRFALGEPISAPVRGDDEIARLDRTFHTMTEMIKESARKEQAVIENARDVICSIGVDLRFVKVNRAALNVWGYDAAELQGQRLSNLIAGAGRDQTIEAFERIIGDQKENAELETKLLHKNGDIIDALWSIHWSKQEQSLFCVVHDISERKKVERLKQEFVNMVSHDLRTPLTSVKGTLSLLTEGVYDAQSDAGKSKLNMAQGNIDRLINLINDLLDIEKLEAGMMAMELQDADLKGVIQSALSAVSGYAEQQRITVKFDPCEITAVADSDRLTQVLVNLLSNAIKFSPPDSTIKVTMSQGTDYAEVRVTDEGKGIPAELRDTIFERFKQADAADGKRGSGTGLGLAISRAIIQSHGGTIGVDSDSGNGSTFWFRVPLATATQAARL